MHVKYHTSKKYNREYVLMLKKADYELVLSAESKENLDKWVNALKKE